MRALTKLSWFDEALLKGINVHKKVFDDFKSTNFYDKPFKLFR